MAVKYILLDRDGVINQERGTHTFLREDFKWVDGLWDGLAELANLGYRFVVITNQSGIAKQMYLHRHVLELNQLIKDEFAKRKLLLDEIFYCPHHPDFSKCICRKPHSGLFEKAVAKYHIDTAKSWMIGDKERDVIPAEKLGINGLLVPANANFASSIKPITQNG